MVTLDSAMFVARMTFTVPGGAGSNTVCCSSCGTCECSGITFIYARSSAGKDSNVFMISLISSQPGRNTNTEPLRPSAVSRAATVRATSAASATTSSSRSRLSPAAPPPPPPFPPLPRRCLRTACLAARDTTALPPGETTASSSRRISTARRSVRTRFANRPLRPRATRPFKGGPPPSISTSSRSSSSSASESSSSEKEPFDDVSLSSPARSQLSSPSAHASLSNASAARSSATASSSSLSKSSSCASSSADASVAPIPSIAAEDVVLLISPVCVSIDALSSIDASSSSSSSSPARSSR
mmetsp:Transcript_6496/g.26312  ORF Transcript_6496/g.26312 Transcript_6496/m.26312 type:complete len:299 (+) Transcript_6496:1246-2142(+)